MQVDLQQLVAAVLQMHLRCRTTAPFGNRDTALVYHSTAAAQRCASSMAALGLSAALHLQQAQLSRGVQVCLFTLLFQDPAVSVHGHVI